MHHLVDVQFYIYGLLFFVLGTLALILTSLGLDTPLSTYLKTPVSQSGLSVAPMVAAGIATLTVFNTILQKEPVQPLRLEAMRMKGLASA